MNEHADRGRMDRLGPPRPLLKGKVRRAAERIEPDCAQFVRQRADHTPTEPVERVVGPVARLLARSEGVPSRAPCHADEHDRPNIRERANPLPIGKQKGAARSEAGTLDGGKDETRSTSGAHASCLER